MLSTAPAAIQPPLPLSPEQFDALVIRHENALLDVQTLKKSAADLEEQIVSQVAAFGTTPPNAKASRRLSGLQKSATLTYTTSTTVNEAGVVELRTYLEQENLQQLFPLFFEQQVPAVYVPPPPRHRRVNGVLEVLAGLTFSLKKRVKEKIAALYSRCVFTTTNAPRLRIDTIQPEPRAAKAAR